MDVALLIIVFAIVTINFLRNLKLSSLTTKECVCATSPRYKNCLQHGGWLYCKINNTFALLRHISTPWKNKFIKNTKDMRFDFLLFVALSSKYRISTRKVIIIVAIKSMFVLALKYSSHAMYLSWDRQYGQIHLLNY